MKTKDAAAGKWRSVLPQVGVPKEVLDGRHHPCPATGQGEDRFRFADRNGSGSYFCDCSRGDKGGIGLIMCCRGLSFAEAAAEVDKVVRTATEEPPKERRDPAILLRKTYKRSEPAGFAVRRYLKERGLECPTSIRQARLTYWDGGNSSGMFDAMVCVLHDVKGKAQSLHVTYLQGTEKAEVTAPRKVLPPIDTITGSAIRLYPAGKVLGVAEGVETAIAAHMMFGHPVWATANAHGIETFQPPEGVERVIVYGDTDESYTGQAAAYALAKRLARSGIACDVELPAVGDWNDVLIEGVS